MELRLRLIKYDEVTLGHNYFTMSRVVEKMEDGRIVVTETPAQLEWREGANSSWEGVPVWTS